MLLANEALRSHGTCSPIVGTSVISGGGGGVEMKWLRGQLDHSAHPGSSRVCGRYSHAVSAALGLGSRRTDGRTAT